MAILRAGQSWYNAGRKATPRMNRRIAKAKKKVNGTEPEFYRNGNFTICVFIEKGRKEPRVRVGVAKRNPNCDEDNPERAKTIAYERALKGESVRLS